MIPKKLGRPRTLPDLHCEQCGKAFRPYSSGSRFCSRACFGAWHSAAGTHRVEKEARVCPVCGKTFYVGGAGMRRSKRLCSLECAGKSHSPPARKMSQTERAWLAGLFDGEGTVIQPRKDRPTSIRLAITNTSMPLLERVQEVTGTGSFVAMKRYSPKHTSCWIWQCHADNARSLLRQMLPWLIVKRAKALEFLAAD